MRLIVQVQSKPKLEMNYYDRSERMWYITKSREDNDLTNRTDVISTEYNIELSIPIG